VQLKEESLASKGPDRAKPTSVDRIGRGRAGQLVRRYGTRDSANASCSFGLAALRLRISLAAEAAKIKTGRCGFQNRPLGSETGQYPRCYEIIGMAKECSDMRELREKVARHYGRQVVQFSLSLPRSSAEPEPPKNWLRR
jgi:hypothetical protein